MEKFKKHYYDKMTPVERLTAINAGQEFDRLPAVLFIPDLKAKLINCSIRDLYFDKEKIIQAEQAAYDRFGSDAIFLGPNSKGIATAFGTKIDYPLDSLPQITHYPLSSYDDLEQVEAEKVLSCERILFFKEVLKDIGSRASGVVPFYSYLGGTVTVASYLRGIEVLLKDMRKNKEQVHELLQRVLKSQMLIVDSYCEIPGIRFAIADPVASGSLMSPRFFKEFALPCLMELCCYIKQKTGYGPLLHMCGKMEKVWPEIKELSLDSFSIDNASSMEEAIDFFGEKFSITGNIPPVDVMYEGTAEMIDQSVKQCIDASQSNPRKLRLAFGCDMPYLAPVENIDHFMQAVRKHASMESIIKTTKRVDF